MNQTHTSAAEAEDRATLSTLVQLTGQRGMSEAAFARMIELLGRRRAARGAIAEAPGHDAETLAESLSGAGEIEVPDCLSCGACCAYFHQIAVTDRDPTPRRLTWAVWEAGAVAGPKTHWLRREPLEGRCIALAGSVGGHPLCAIYELRPHSCRAFEAGSDRCRAARRAYGLEPPLSEIARAEHAKRVRADDELEMNEVEALAGRDAASLTAAEKIGLLGGAIAYNRAKLGDILAEAQRLHAWLAEKGSRAAALNAARQVSAIHAEALAVTAALADSHVIGSLDSLAGAEVDGLCRTLLAVAAQSQAAVARAARWLRAIGEAVFATFEMRPDPTAPKP